jgi:branched-chain amino acid aminotransferase
MVFLDGQWVDEEDATIPANDRGFLFADGVFETGLLANGRYFRLDAHLQRLTQSAALLGVPVPPAAELARIAAEIAERNGIRDGSLRITLTAGHSSNTAGSILVTLVPRDDAWIRKARDGWNIITAQTTRPSTRAIPAQLKALGRTYALLARREARIASADDALLLTDDGMICEGPTWNVMWRTGNTIRTPALELGVLAGVTRAILLDAARDLGFTTEEGAFPRSELDHADEIFATMTSAGVACFRSLDTRMLPEHTPAADALLERYYAVIAAECGGNTQSQAAAREPSESLTRE